MQEALDYLLQEPSPAHPRPDIILMDVQMPIMDGYRATHTIRTAEPFREQIRDIPIVAMTASAIQGDKEKCQKAGMDDYLSKPVRGPVLEKMLLKWTMESTRTATTLRRHESLSLESDYSAASSAPSRAHSPPTAEQRNSISAVAGTQNMMPSQQERLPTTHEAVSSTAVHAKRPKPHSPPSSLSYLEKATLQQSSMETANMLEQRRLQNEEKASRLRDDKMLAATDGPLSPHQLLTEDEIRREATQETRHQLTRENLDRHTSDHMLPTEARIKKKGQESTTGRRSEDTQHGG
jgi:CheY-like chemotaxis protein